MSSKAAYKSTWSVCGGKRECACLGPSGPTESSAVETGSDSLARKFLPVSHPNKKRNPGCLTSVLDKLMTWISSSLCSRRQGGGSIGFGLLPRPGRTAGESIRKPSYEYRATAGSLARFSKRQLELVTPAEICATPPSGSQLRISFTHAASFND